MKCVLLVFQISVLVGHVFSACPQKGVEQPGQTSDGKPGPTPHDRTFLSGSKPGDHSDLKVNPEGAKTLTPIEASMANAKRIVGEIPDKSMEVTVIRPSEVMEKEFTMSDLMKEVSSDTTQFPNKIDDFDLGPNASF